MKLFLTCFLLFSIQSSQAQDSTRHLAYDRTYTKLKIEAVYPGGPAAWLRFLNKNMHLPQEPLDDLPGGTTVVVQFIVDTAGHTSDIQAISGAEELRREAVRVIKISGTWMPAIQNGRKVKSYKRQPILIELGRQ